MKYVLFLFQIINLFKKESSSKYSEAIDALTVLGFNRATAEEVLKTIDVANTELEDIIRDALKKLMK